MPSTRLEFFYEFASTYSYLSAIRIAQLGETAGVEIAWRPFLLGPIFASQGWTTSPFNLYPAKGRYMVRDIERIAAGRGRAFVMPAAFPANGLAAARIALCGEDAGWIGGFTRRVYEAQFERRADISDTGVLSDILKAMTLDADAVLAQSRSSEIKDRLRAQSQRADRPRPVRCAVFRHAGRRTVLGRRQARTGPRLDRCRKIARNASYARLIVQNPTCHPGRSASCEPGPRGRAHDAGPRWSQRLLGPVACATALARDDRDAVAGRCEGELFHV